LVLRGFTTALKALQARPAPTLAADDQTRGGCCQSTVGVFNCAHDRYSDGGIGLFAPPFE